MRRRASLPALAALVLIASPALAQKRSSRPRPRPRPPATKPAPAPQPVPEAPVAAPATPAPEPSRSAPATPAPKTVTPAAAPTQASVATAGPAFFAEGFLGGLFFRRTETTSVPGYGSVSATVEPPPLLRLGARLGAPFLRVDERVSLEWLGTLGVGATGSKQEMMGYTLRTQALSLEVLPGLRARMSLMPGLSLTAEAGMGVQFTRATTQMTFVGEKAQGSAHGLLRLALGGQYAIDSRLRVYFEPVGLHALVGQGGGVAWSLQAGVGYVL